MLRHCAIALIVLPSLFTCHYQPTTAGVIRTVQEARPRVSQLLTDYADIVFAHGSPDEQADARRRLPKIARARAGLHAAEILLINAVNAGKSQDEVADLWVSALDSAGHLSGLIGEIPSGTIRAEALKTALQLAVAALQRRIETVVDLASAGETGLTVSEYSVTSWYRDLAERHQLEPLVDAGGAQ